MLLAAILAALVAQPFVVHLSTSGRVAYDLFVAAVLLGVFPVVFRERQRQVAVVSRCPRSRSTVALYVVGPARGRGLGRVSRLGRALPPVSRSR
jgi:hypothetical protein